jgi:hypothetical protein
MNFYILFSGLYTNRIVRKRATDRVTMNGRGEAWYYLDLQLAQEISIQYNYVYKITKEAKYV